MNALLVTVLLLTAVDAGAPPASIDCRADLDRAASLLLANDAGVRARGWTAYPDGVAKRLAEQRDAASRTTLPRKCADVIWRFLGDIRKGHLFTIPVSEAGLKDLFDPASAPKIEVRRLSARTVYLRVPSFGLGIGAQLEQAIARNEARIRQAQNLIVDVRNNDGGFDSSYKPLLGLLGPATYRSSVPDLLVTETNLSGYKAILKQIPATQEHERNEIAAIIDRMSAAWKDARGRSAIWIPQTDHEEVTTVGGDAVKARPDRVWVMTGPACGSSCEQFVLDLEQNPRVTLVGRPTHGSIDASNVRPVRLPSGTINLWYATTYVRRPPGQEIDDVGIRPSVPLPTPKDDAAFAREVTDVQRMAERRRPGKS